jgi:hypothetical protein
MQRLHYMHYSRTWSACGQKCISWSSSSLGSNTKLVGQTVVCSEREPGSYVSSVCDAKAETVIRCCSQSLEGQYASVPCSVYRLGAARPWVSTQALGIALSRQHSTMSVLFALGRPTPRSHRAMPRPMDKHLLRGRVCEGTLARKLRDKSVWSFGGHPNCHVRKLRLAIPLL